MGFMLIHGPSATTDSLLNTGGSKTGFTEDELVQPDNPEKRKQSSNITQNFLIALTLQDNNHSVLLS
jgi:hypothetical protein